MVTSRATDKQCDPEREHVLAVLAQAEIDPYNGDDDTEQGDTEDEE